MIANLLLNKTTNIAPLFSSVNNFSTSPSDPSEYAESTAAGACGNIPTPEGRPNFAQFCRSIDIEDSNTVSLTPVPRPSDTYTVGDLCPNIDPSYTPQDCHAHYLLADIMWENLPKCSESDNTRPPKVESPSDLSNLVDSIESVNETSNLNFINNFYEFFVNQPLLAENYFQTSLFLFLGFAVFYSFLSIRNKTRK